MNIEGKIEAINELLKLLEEQYQETDGFTRKDLQNKIGCGRVKADGIVDRLLEAEYIEPTTIYRKNRVGIFTTLYGYRLTAKAQDRAAAQS